MALSKGKKHLSFFFRRAMRNIGKSSNVTTHTAEASAGEFPVNEVVGIPIIDDLKHLCAPSNSGPDFGEKSLSHQISYGLCERDNDNGFPKNTLETSEPKNVNNILTSKTKQASRVRIQTGNFKRQQLEFMKNLTRGCARKLGPETTFDVMDKFGKDGGEKEYNAKVKICVQHARRSNDAEYAFDQIGKAIELLKKMRQLGFYIEEGTYGPFFKYLVDMEMVEEFQIFKNFIKEGSPDSCGKLVYYEMLLWIQLGDEEKIYKLCNTIDDSGITLPILQEYYLVALCEKDRKENLQTLLESIDITQVSSPNVLKTVFGYLGKSLLESLAMKLLWELRECGKDGVKTVSNLIFSYATCIPNSTVEDAILKFNKLHEELDIVPSSTSYEKLVSYLSGSNEVATALGVVERMCEGLVISANILHSLLQAIEQILEFNLVQRIYSIMNDKNVEPDSETFRRMISLCIRIKDFKGAYNMLGNLKNFNLTPNSTMYNPILAGYCREKKVDRALMVLKEMKEADVKPDSMTFSYLINYCDQEEAIAEYYEEMKQAGLQASKHVYMSLIKAYASCGQFEKAKQVLMDPEVGKDRNELKSVLISSLASNGKITDALSIYKEMKGSLCPVEPKTIISLIEHSDSNEELRTLIQLVRELHDSKYWIDGFFKTIVFAVRNNKSSSILDLLKQGKNQLDKDDVAVEYWFEEVFRSIAETEHSEVKLGLELVSFMKEEVDLCPSRKCLDFLLHACVNAKDKQNALLVWQEYQFAELPYNVLNYLRMYQVLVAAGDSTSAKAMVSEMPNDKDVQCVIKESRIVFTPKLEKKKSKKKRLSLQAK